MKALLPKVNKTQVMDSFLALLLIMLAPWLLKQIAPSVPLTGITGTAAATGLVYVGGGLMKKPAVSNFALGAGLAQIALSFIMPEPQPLPKVVKTITPGVQAESSQAVDRYMYLNEYVEYPALTTKRKYAQTYS